MAIIEFHGGPITHRYLMNKRKDDLARMYLELLRIRERDLITYGDHTAECELVSATALGRPVDAALECTCGYAALTNMKGPAFRERPNTDKNFGC